MPDSRDRTALWIVDAGQQRTQTVLLQRCRAAPIQVANFLRAQGLKRGDHLLLLLGNVVPLWETMLAAMKLGVVVIPATTLLTADELRDRLDRRQGEGGGGHAGSGREVCWARRRQCWSASWSARRRRTMAGCRSRRRRARPKSLRLMGRPTPTTRCCSISPRAPRQNRSWCGTASAAIRSAISRPCTGIGLQPGDVHLNISSPGWAKHAWSCLFAPWNAGATVFVVNQPRFDAKALLATVGRCGVTTLCAPPTVWRLFIQEKLANFKVSLREVCGAGEPLNPEVIDQVKAAWGLTIRDGYGQTETTALAGNSPGQKVKVGSMGRPLPGYRVQISRQ